MTLEKGISATDTVSRGGEQQYRGEKRGAIEKRGSEKHYCSAMEKGKKQIRRIIPPCGSGV